MVVGDFKGGTEEAAIEDRKAVSIDKNNFSAVMAESDLAITSTVPNLLSEQGPDLPINLSFRSLADFSPDAVVQQVPQLSQLIELREALVALKGPLGNISAFRQKLQALLSSEESREQLLAELQRLDPEYPGNSTDNAE